MEFEKIRDCIADHTDLPKDSITPETNFKDDLNTDSLDLFQIISDLEDIFNIEFTNEDAENIKTVGDAAQYIKKALGS